MMKKLLSLFFILFFVIIASAQQLITVPQSFKVQGYINVRDSIRSTIYFQNTNDTLATKAYARGFAAGTVAGYGIIVNGNTVTLDTSKARKMDSLYTITDSTGIFKINGIVYSFKISGNIKSFNGRIGLVVPNKFDYSPFYPRLDSTYVDPSFIQSLSWPKITATPNTLANYGILDAVKNKGSANSWQVGALSNRPAVSGLGNFYFSTDDSTIYFDNGVRWIRLTSLDSSVINGYGLKKNITGGTNIQLVVDTTALKSVFGSTSPGIFQLYTKYPAGININGTDTISVDTTKMTRFSDTTTTLATRSYVTSRGYLLSETDPVATAKNVTINVNSGNGILRTGAAVQTIGAQPTYTLAADTTILATSLALLDTAKVIRALIGPPGITQIFNKYGIIIAGTDTLTVDTTKFTRFSDTTTKLATKYYVNSQGFLTTETDPVATAKTISDTAGYGVLIGGLTTQTIGNSPKYKHTVDTTVIAPLHRIGDTAAVLRQLLNFVPHTTVTTIRGIVPANLPSQHVYLEDPNAGGFFYVDNLDVTSVDDSVMTFVTTGGVRLKRLIITPYVSVRWFGATGNGLDQTYAIQKAINWIESHTTYSPTTNVYFPYGNYLISKPLLITNWNGSSFGQVTVHLIGEASAKNSSAGISAITTNFNNTFAIGIQQGKDCSIENLTITGSYNASSFSQISVDTLTLAQWSDGSVRTDVYSPYAGIVIDPFTDSTKYPLNSDLYPGLHGYCPAGMNRSGSTQILVKNTFITHFWVASIVSPGWQQNGEDIVYDEVNVGGNAVGIALCQAQSKNILVRNFQSWDNIHTIFDNATFGIRTGSIGGGQFKVTYGNVAGNSYQLVNIGAANFKSSFDHIYAEGLFKIGIAKGASGVNFEACDLNFSVTGRGLPYPDFFVYGDNLMFKDCQLRQFDGNNGVGTSVPTRLIFSGITAKFIGGTTNAPPIVGNANTSVYGGDVSFDRLANFYNSVSSSTMTGNDGHAFGVPIYPGIKIATNVNGGAQYIFTYANNYDRIAQLPSPVLLRINKSNWSGSFNAAGQELYLRPGDYLLNGTLTSFQEGLALSSYPVGCIDSINTSNHMVYLKNVVPGFTDSTNYTLYTDYALYTNDQFMGSVSPSTNYISGVRVTSGTVASNFPVGTRLDLPMFEIGDYVTKTNVDTIFMSRNNTLTYADQTNTASPYFFMNGYPKIDIRSPMTPETMLSAYTVYGNSTYYYQFNTPNIGGYSNGPMSNQNKEIYAITNGVYNHDTSTYKLKYHLLASVARGQSIPIGTTAQSFPSGYSNEGTIRINTDSGTSFGANRATINDGKGYRALAYLADINGIVAGTSPFIMASSYGVVGDSLTTSATSNTTGLRSAIAACPAKGCTIVIPYGTVYINDTILITQGMHIMGFSPSLTIGQAPNPAGNYGAKTQVVQLTHNKSAFVVNTQNSGYRNGVAIDGFAILADTTGSTVFTSGSAIKFIAGGYFTLRDMVFNYFWTNVDVQANSTYWTIDHCQFWSAVRDGLHIGNTALSDEGDWQVSNCVFYSDLHKNNRSGIYWTGSGGGRIVSNKFNGNAFGFKSTYGVYMSMVDGQTSDMLISNNSMEGIDSSAVYFDSAGKTVFQNFQFLGNQVGGINAKGPAIRPFPSAVGANSHVVIGENIFSDFGTPGSSNAIEVSNFLDIHIGDNQTNYSNIYASLGNTSKEHILYTNFNSAGIIGTSRSNAGTEYWQLANNSNNASAVGQIELDNDNGGQMGMNLTSSTNSNPSNGKLFSAKKLTFASDNSVLNGGTDPIIFSPGGSSNEFARMGSGVLSIGSQTPNLSTDILSLYGTVNNALTLTIQNPNLGTSAGADLFLKNGLNTAVVGLKGQGASTYANQNANNMAFYSTGDIAMLADGARISMATGTTPSSTNTEKFAIEKSGQLTLNSAYPAGTFAGTPAYTLGVDASNHVITFTGSGAAPNIATVLNSAAQNATATWAFGGNTTKLSGLISDTTNIAYVLVKKKDSTLTEMTPAQFLILFGATDTLTALNGLTQSGPQTNDTLALGGAFTKNTSFDGTTNHYNITYGSPNSLGTFGVTGTGNVSLTSTGGNVSLSTTNNNPITLLSNGYIALSPSSYTSIAGTIAVSGWNEITTGTSATLLLGNTNVLFNPASVIASYTLTLPASPPDGARIKIHAGGTITGTATVVTTFSVSANAGQTLMQKTAPTTLAANDCLIYQYNSTHTAWYREQ